MAYYPTEGGDDTEERRREEAKRGTEIALERERLQQANRERQHKDNLRIKLNQKEGDLRRKERELGAIELEDNHLTRVAASIRTAAKPATSRTISSIERLIREVRTKIDTLRRQESTIESEMRSQSPARASSKSRDTTRALEIEIAQARSEDTEVLRAIADLKRRLEEKEANHAALLREIETEERELARTKNTMRNAEEESASATHEAERTTKDRVVKIERLKDEERALSTELTAHERELEDAKAKVREEEDANRNQENLSRAASSRKAEHERKAHTLKTEIETLTRDIAKIKRDIE